jgi:hypothetical protein
MRFWTLALALLLLGACGGDDVVSRAEDVPSVVTGLITSITPAEGDLESFVVEQDGTSYEILIAEDIDYGFDLQHLRQHLTEELPVVVTVEARDGAAIATSIEDAPE